MLVLKNHLLYTSQKFAGGITWLDEWIGNVKQHHGTQLKIYI
jgi:hypothetical protein